MLQQNPESASPPNCNQTGVIIALSKNLEGSCHLDRNIGPGSQSDRKAISEGLQRADANDRSLKTITMNCPTPSKHHLLDLPPETVDEIIAHISSPSSLLAVARTCKALARLVIPDHLHFRVIRAPIGRTELWKSILRDDLHAASVRSLIIQDEQTWDADETPSKIPPFTGLAPEARRERALGNGPGQLDAYGEAVPMFGSAIRRMFRLNEFAWHRAASTNFKGMDDVWTALQELGTVTTLDISDHPDGDGTIEGTIGDLREASTPSIVFSDSFLRFSGLTTLKLHTSAFDHQTDEPDATPLVDMLLHSCPDLEVLKLTFVVHRHLSSASMTSLLLNATWPNLHTLHLTEGVGCSVDSLVRFLETHPGIEDLSLGRMMPGRSWERFAQALDTITPILPRLKTLECSSAQAAALLKPSMITLTDLLGVDMRDEIVIDDYFGWDDEWELEHAEDEVDEEEDATVLIPSPWKALFLRRLAACPSIRHLGVTHYENLGQLEVLATIAPQLTWLDIDTCGLLVDSVAEIAQWCAFYSLFPSLKTIRAEHLVYRGQHGEYSMNENDDCIQALARACPRLEVLILWKRKIILIRDKAEQVGVPVRWISRMLDAREEVDGEVVYPTEQ